jgi:hypothetical protein
VDELLTIAHYDNIQESKKWNKKLPVFHFKQEWNVRIIPPFQGAIIRFTIKYNGKRVSVYFDGYSRLGQMHDSNYKPIPYFQCTYEKDSIKYYYLDESENMMKDIETFLES